MARTSVAASRAAPRPRSGAHTRAKGRLKGAAFGGSPGAFGTRLHPCLSDTGTPGASHQAAASTFSPLRGAAWCFAPGFPPFGAFGAKTSLRRRLRGPSDPFAYSRFFRRSPVGQFLADWRALFAPSARLFTLFQSVKSRDFITALFHAFFSASR